MLALFMWKYLFNYLFIGKTLRLARSPSLSVKLRDNFLNKSVYRKRVEK